MERCGEDGKKIERAPYTLSRFIKLDNFLKKLIQNCIKSKVK